MTLGAQSSSMVIPTLAIENNVDSFLLVILVRGLQQSVMQSTELFYAPTMLPSLEKHE